MIHNQQNSRKYLNLYIILSAVFLTNAIIAEVIGVKIFSLEKIMRTAPLGLPFIGGTKLDLNMSVGVIIWPIVFIITDIINEYYGRTGVRRISIIGAGMITYAFVAIYLATEAPAAEFWLENNPTDNTGNPFDINFAYRVIFRQGLGIIVGSVTAFLVGQLVDAYTFHWLRKITSHKKLWLRATGSTVVSQLVDSFMILFIAFYLLGNWSLTEVFAVGIIQYCYKVILAIVLTPVIYWMHYIIDRYLGKDKSVEMMERAQEE